MKKLLFVLSAYHGDAGRALEMTKWMVELGTKTSDRALFFTTKRATLLPEIGQIITNLQQVFEGGVTHIGLKMEEERGPWYSNNFMFRSVAQYIEHKVKDIDGFYFFEPDCTPTAPDWWDAIRAEYSDCDMPFMGDIRGISHALNSPLHMNGSAIYPQNVAKYSVLALRAESDPWDTLAREEILPHAQATKLIATYFNTIDYRVRGNDIVVRIGLDGQQNKGDEVLVTPRAKVIHGCKDGTLLNILRARRSSPAKLEPAPAPVPGKSVSAAVNNHDAESLRTRTAGRRAAMKNTSLSATEVKSVRSLISTLEIFCENDHRRGQVKALLKESEIFAS